jgi:hypothetical protein
MNKGYIEFRVYFEAGLDDDLLSDAAEDIRDEIIDLLADDEEPKMFNQDVTYEVVRNKDDE